MEWWRNPRTKKKEETRKKKDKSSAEHHLDLLSASFKGLGGEGLRAREDTGTNVKFGQDEI